MASIGLVEVALQTSLVGFGVTGRVATLAIAGYRFVSFWLPIPIGALAYLSLRIGPEKEEEPTERALTGLVREAAGESESVREWATRIGLRDNEHRPR